MWKHCSIQCIRACFGVREKLFEVMDASATMPLLIGAVAIGAVLILMTMIINIYLNIKRKEMAEALFSQNGVAGFIFYGYIILFLIGMFMPDMLPFNPGSKPLMVLFIGVPVVLFFMKEPLNGLMKGEGLTPHQGWGNFALEEVFEVLEIILSFVTNSLSYLRVGGFVLSHAGMMLVVMTLVKSDRQRRTGRLRAGQLVCHGLRRSDRRHSDIASGIL